MPNKNDTSILDAIKLTHKNKGPVYAWQLGDELLSKVELSLESYSLERNELTFACAEDQLSQLNMMITGLGKIHFYIAEQSLLFTSEIKKLNETGKLVVAFPSSKQETQFFDRRSSQRFEILAHAIFVTFQYNNKEFRKPCFDISRGGLSFIFSQNERVPFQDGEFLNDLNLCIGKNKLILSGKIVRILKLKPFMLEKIPYGGSRISLQFCNIHPDQEATLEKFTSALEDLLKKKSSRS